MTRRSLAAHALALILLLAALAADERWGEQTGPLPVAPGAALGPAWDLGAAPLRSLELRTGDARLRLRRRAEVEGSAWVESLSGAEGSPAPPHQAFPGNQRALDLLRDLARPPVQRELGPLSVAQREELGLGAEAAFLTLAAEDGRTLTVRLGSEVFGSGQRYGSVDGAAPVFLLARRTLADLSQAERKLLDRRISTLALEQVQRAEIEGADLPLPARLAREEGGELVAEPDAKGPDAAWLGRLLALEASGYPASAAGSPEAATPFAVVLRVHLQGPGTLVESLELQASQAGEHAQYRVRSIFTGGRPAELPGVATRELLRSLGSPGAETGVAAPR